MMISNNSTPVIWLLLPFVAACSQISPDEDGLSRQTGRTETCFIARALEEDGEKDSKSLFSSGENTVKDVNVWCYLDGELDASHYGTGTSASLRLYSGKTYHVYALANTGKMEAPALETGLSGLECATCPQQNTLFEGGLPMSSGCIVIQTGVSSQREIIGMRRLVAKYILKIHIGEETVSRVELTEVKIRNAVTTVTPFSEGNCPSSVTDGDVAVPTSSSEGCETILYIPENIRGEQLDEEHCTYVEIKGRLRYTDRPSEDSAYILNQDMTYRWYLRDSQTSRFDVVRNTAYSAVFSWSDFGWIPDVDNVSIDEVLEDGTYTLNFCDSAGVPVSDVVFRNANAGCTASLYWRAYPAESAADVEFSTSVSPSRLMLTETEVGTDVGDGVFRTSYVSGIDRSCTSDMIATVTNTAKGICCSAHYHFTGSGSRVAEWDKDDDEYVDF